MSETKTPKSIQRSVLILDHDPKVMNRLICLIDGHAYAATWLYLLVIEKEVAPEGEEKTSTAPTTKRKLSLVIIDENGKFYCDDPDVNFPPLSSLRIETHFKDMPPKHKLWSPEGVKRYAAGSRPDAVDVFRRIVDIITTFIDFDHSLADQQTMAELIACYILATWFLDAFTAIGFLWPNGQRGSGKTQLLVLITELAYLGQLILAGGSFASLRDMADLGATLGFDDAENLSGTHQVDPDKRALLLAGNRKGNTVPVKEPAGKRGWQTRYVNTFCARMFSAIKIPDPVLASRTITIPLLRTTNYKKANADPLDYVLWPHGKQPLLDDLWALGLTHIKELQNLEREINQVARLSGRNLEPWRAILAVALWLEKQGMKGIWQRLDELSYRYCFEFLPDLQSADLTLIVLRAVMECASNAVSAGSASEEMVFITTEQITQVAKSIVEDEEIAIAPFSKAKVGSIMRSLRFESKRPKGSEGRGWIISLKDMDGLSMAYGINVSSLLDSDGTTGTTGTNGAHQVISFDDLIAQWEATGPDNTKPCFACGKVAWRERPPEQGGKLYCSVCHPNEVGYEREGIFFLPQN